MVVSEFPQASSWAGRRAVELYQYDQETEVDAEIDVAVDVAVDVELDELDVDGEKIFLCRQPSAITS